jgi:cytoskeletal protein CcmA (bactofilin family)
VKSSGTITIKAGGVTVKMSAGKIQISGKFDGGVQSDEQGSHKYE